MYVSGGLVVGIVLSVVAVLKIVRSVIKPSVNLEFPRRADKQVIVATNIHWWQSQSCHRASHSNGANR